MSKKKRGKKQRGKKQPLPEGWANVWTDGACIGNPGLMGIGVVFQNGGATEKSVSESCGYGTNNEAEYLAVLRAVELAAEFQYRGVRVRTDSQLVVNQLNGEYAINQPHLYKLAQKIKKKAQGLTEGFSILWTSRESNKEADALASKGAGTPQAPTREEYEGWSPDPEFVPDSAALSKLPEGPQGIKNLLAKNEPKFKDFLQLKVGGRDGYSNLSPDSLMEIVRTRHGDKAVEWIQKALEEAISSSYGKNALRWCARGLSPDLALKKASVDLEARKKFQKK